jgi:thioredoxin
VVDRALNVQLTAEFGAPRVFFGTITIEPGDDFVEVLGAKVGGCRVLLAVIGPRWLDMLDSRLAETNDFVRIEIAEALRRGERVVPVLIDGAMPPVEARLPADLKPLARRNAIWVRAATFATDAGSLVEFLRRHQDGPAVLATPPSGEQNPPSQTQSAVQPRGSFGSIDDDIWTIDDILTVDDRFAFQRDVLEGSRDALTLVDFWAPWCGPCRQLSPLLEKVVKSYNGKVRLAKVDTDKHSAIASMLRVQSLPAVMAFRDGRSLDGFVGARSEREIKSFIEKLLSA